MSLAPNADILSRCSKEKKKVIEWISALTNIRQGLDAMNIVEVVLSANSDAIISHRDGVVHHSAPNVEAISLQYQFLLTSHNLCNKGSQ